MQMQIHVDADVPGQVHGDGFAFCVVSMLRPCWGAMHTGVSPFFCRILVWMGMSPLNSSSLSVSKSTNIAKGNALTGVSLWTTKCWCTWTCYYAPSSSVCLYSILLHTAKNDLVLFGIHLFYKAILATTPLQCERDGRPQPLLCRHRAELCCWIGPDILLNPAFWLRTAEKETFVRSPERSQFLSWWSKFCLDEGW